MQALQWLRTACILKFIQLTAMSDRKYQFSYYPILTLFTNFANEQTVKKAFTSDRYRFR